MPYTFGAATADDVNYTKAIGAGAGGTSVGSTNFIWGWWLPTTLTATRGLWSCGNVFGAEVDTTTSELRLRTDNTTDGQWTTTGAALAVNKWSFLAFLSSVNNTGTAAAWRVWMGTEDTAPIEITVTNAVAPVGNFTGSAAFTIGNKGTGTLAWQGDIAGVGIRSSQITTVGLNAFNLAAQGAITADEAEFNYRRLVLPAWLGQPPLVGPCVRLHGGFGGTTQGDEVTYIDLDVVPAVVNEWRELNALVDSTSIATINGATTSLKRGPVYRKAGDLFMPPRVLRR